MRWILRGLVELIFPPACAVCLRDRSDDRFCPECARALPRLPPRERAWRTAEGRAVWSLFRYQDPVRRVLLGVKYHGHPHGARELGTLVGEELPDRRALGWPDCVVPVPLGRRRRRERGFNQAELLASPVARLLGLPVARLVRRARERPPQATLTASARRRNLQGTFTAERAFSRSVLVVDDVVTTGSTLDAVALALEAAGARRVTAVTLCRADLSG